MKQKSNCGHRGSRMELRQHGESGFVMLVVLWILTAATILVVSFNGAVRSSAASATAEVDWTVSEALLDGGLEVAAAHLIDLNEKQRWPGDGTPHAITFAGAKLVITAMDANGLIDVNQADEKLLRSFLRKFASSPVEADRLGSLIMEARDAAVSTNSNTPSKTKDSASQDTFRAHMAFADVWQLGRTRGVPESLFKRIEPYLTVYSAEGTINAATAPAKILEAIPDINRADLIKLKYSGSDASNDALDKARSYLTQQRGPAFIVTVSAQRSANSHRVERMFAIGTGIDPSAPYRLLAKWPTVSSSAEKM